MYHVICLSSEGPALQLVNHCTPTWPNQYANHTFHYFIFAAVLYLTRFTRTTEAQFSKITKNFATDMKVKIPSRKKAINQNIYLVFAGNNTKYSKKVCIQ